MIGNNDSASALNLIQNGSFESANSDPGSSLVQLSTGSTDINDWTVTGGGIDYVGSLWTASNGSRSLDLSGMSPGGISQTLNTIVGQVYKVTFDLAGNPTDTYFGKSVNPLKSMTLSTGANSETFTFDVSGKSTSNMGWESKTWMFTATSSTTTLSFISNNNDPFGPALDNVSMTAVPEPLTIMGTFLAGGIGIAMKKKMIKSSI